MDLHAAVSTYGASAKSKLANVAASGQPEDQLRSPFEKLLKDLSSLSGLNNVAAVGESSLSDLKIRPDFAVTVQNALIGHVELKAPGKGADPKKYKDAHDKDQWAKLQSLPNLMYSDGNAFSLWRDGTLWAPIVRLKGDIETSGAKLDAGDDLLNLFTTFLSWHPIAPRSAKELARTSARLCRLLRDEVTEQLANKNTALTALANDWRKVLFPDADDATFADGYAQAVTFGLLMARAKGIDLAQGFHGIASELAQSSTLIGAAMKLLTDDAVSQKALLTSLQTLTRVLNVVDWKKVSKNNPEAWLYFYEDFLEVYDNALRKKTGSYYTPPEVVEAMVRLVDEELKSTRYKQPTGMASPALSIADPAVGTGTFLLGILKRIAESVEKDQGRGAVNAAIRDATKRLVAFEIQLGPFAVAQLRVLAEIVELTGDSKPPSPRMFVTDTLGSPDDLGGWMPAMLAPIASSLTDANKVKRDEPITVVIGNPPYKEKAKGRGSWVEGADAKQGAPLLDWIPPASWGVGAHAKHLRNLYVYFWRWATWKVFDHGPGTKSGIVCFITMSGFLNGPGFQRMREYLRRNCERIWVIDCSPEGHQPPVGDRIFQGVQQPVCIVLASRPESTKPDAPAKVVWRALPEGSREDKFDALARIKLTGSSWIDCPTDARGPFLPASTTDWGTFPALDDFFGYNGSGVMPGRTWVIAPDEQSLADRWNELVAARGPRQETLFHPHLRGGKPGDKHTKKVVGKPLAGQAGHKKSIADEPGALDQPVRYAYRSFDRQFIIPDARLINQPNPGLWDAHSHNQIYITAPSDRSATNGPALTCSAAIPDLHHYNGRGGRVLPLWRDRAALSPNLRERLVTWLSSRWHTTVDGSAMFAYIAAIAANRAFTERFKPDLTTPGIRVPLTDDATLFARAVEIGMRVIWLHTFGERMADNAAGRPPGPPRLSAARQPKISAGGAIPSDPESMPETITYDPAANRVFVGTGYIDNVPQAVWDYEVSGKSVLKQWFSYRGKNRDKPPMGDKRPPSPLSSIQPDHWLSEYTTELINVINVLGLLVDLESEQEALLTDIMANPLISRAELDAAKVFQDKATLFD